MREPAAAAAPLLFSALTDRANVLLLAVPFSLAQFVPYQCGDEAERAGERQGGWDQVEMLQQEKVERAAHEQEESKILSQASSSL
jgi:hypothetical protein